MEVHYSYQMILEHFVLPTYIPLHDKHGFRDLTYHCVDNIGNAVLVLCRASRSAGHTKRLTEKDSYPYIPGLSYWPGPCVLKTLR